MKRYRPLDWLKPAMFTGTALPFFVLAFRAATGQLGANPVATALNQLGLLALVLLIASLTCTPLKIMFGWTWQMRLRKMLGLAAFFAGVAHFLVYLLLDQGLDVAAVLEDIAKRPFIAVGFATLVLLVPLALTSRKTSPKRLGFKRWQQLHRLAYLCGVLAVVHYFLRVKADITEPLIYGGVLAYLLFSRVVETLKTRKQKAARAT